MADLKKEFEFYLSNKAYFLRHYRGKFIVLKSCKVQGVHESRLEAIANASKKYRLGTFIVQHVEKREDVLTLGMRIEVG